MDRVARWATMAAALLASAPLAANAQQRLPLWELGGVVGAGYLPDYPAADEYSKRILPLPYFVYRGRIFRSEESGLLRGRILQSERIEFDISVAGALNSKSADNRARAGMPDLDFMGQIGPRLQITLARAARAAHIDFELPARAVLSTDFSRVHHIGFMSVPELAYQHENFFGNGTRVKAGIGLTFADREFQDVLYGVPEEFATASRPAYAAKGGYMGAKLSAGFALPLTASLRVLGQVRGDFHQGAANEDSPLFRSKATGTVLVGAIWTFWRSRQTVIE